MVNRAIGLAADSLPGAGRGPGRGPEEALNRRAAQNAAPKKPSTALRLRRRGRTPQVASPIQRSSCSTRLRLTLSCTPLRSFTP